jgi:tetratricopeptide (TPR) repeat protein
MARPAKLLGFALCSALLVPTMQLAGAAAQGPGQLRGVGDRFLNGSGAGEAVTRQEPVTLIATQIPGFFGAGDPLQVGTVQEPWDLDPLTGAEPQVELLPLLATPPQMLAQINSRQAEADRLFNQGLQQFNTSQYQGALESWQAALAIYREIGNREREGDTLNALGVLFSITGQPQTTINFYQQALAIAREIGDQADEGRTLANLGSAYFSLGQYDHAIDLYEQQLEIAREIGDRLAESKALGGLGNAYLSLGQYNRAIDFYEQSLAITREISNRLQEGRTLGNLSTAYFSLGQYELSIDLYERSLAIAREMEDRTGEGAALGNLGIAYFSLGQYERAIKLYEQHLAITREMEDRAGEGAALGNLGNIYRNLGQYERALEQYGKAVAIFNQLGVRAGEALFLSNIGILLNDRDQPELAIIFLKASVDVREAIRGDIRGLSTDLQQSFTDTVAADYRLLADLLLQQNRILEAQRVLDLLKVQELDDALRTVQRTSDTASGVAFWEIESDLLALYSQTLADADELADLRNRGYDNLTAAEQQRFTELNRRYGEVQQRFAAFLNRPEVDALLSQIRATTDGQNLDIENQYRALQNNLRALPQKTALLYPLILPDRLELVLITADNPPLRYPIAVTGADLNRAIVAMGQALKDPGSDIQPLAQQLYPG